MRASLGQVRLRPLRSTRFLAADGEPLSYADVEPPGALVGRGEDADVRIDDSDGYVSRRHALIEPQGLSWVVRDNDSAHGTGLQGPGKRLQLPAQVPVPLMTGDELVLAGTARFSIEVIVATPTGVRTKNAPPRGSIAYISDPVTLQLADELLRPRREDPRSTAAPSVADLSRILHVEERTVYYRLDKLKAIDEIRRQIPSRRASPSQIADAVARAYPYLASPRRPH
jgi:predicted component of type VI protein secretion system